MAWAARCFSPVGTSTGWLLVVSFPADTVLKPCRGRSGAALIPPTGQEGEKISVISGQFADPRCCAVASKRKAFVASYSENIALRKEPLLFLPRDGVDDCW